MQSRGVSEIGNNLFDFAEGDEITESFLAREEPDGLAALVFGDVGAKEFLGLEAGGEEMNVVDKGIANAGSG